MESKPSSQCPYSCIFLKFVNYIYVYIYVCMCVCVCVPVSSVGIATDYGLDGPGIESRWGRGFPPIQTVPGAHPASCTMGTGSFLWVKYGRSVTLTPHPLLVPQSWKIRVIPLPTFWATTGPVTGTLLLLQILHFIYGFSTKIFHLFLSLSMKESDHLKQHRQCQ